MEEIVGENLGRFPLNSLGLLVCPLPYSSSNVGISPFQSKHSEEKKDTVIFELWILSSL